MALSNEDDSTQLASPSKKKNVPVVAHVGNLIDIDPHSELIFETPPPDVVNSINECFEQYNNKKNDTSVHQPSSDSDSGGSLFITQSVTKAVRTERRHRSSKRRESISDDSGNERDNGDTENERGSMSRHAECPNRRKIISHPAPRKAVFPFLLKSLGRQHLSLKKHQILENSEMGGFLKCIKKIEEGYVNTGRAISPSVLESDLSDHSEGDDHDSDHEVTKVDRTTFVPSFFKGNKHKWLPQSFLDMRLQDSLSDDNEQLVHTNRKAKQSKTKSTKKNTTSASVKKQSKKKNEAPKNKALVRTSSESSIDPLFKEQEKQHETQEVLAACSDAEHSDSAHCRQRLTKQIIQCAENLHGDHLVVIEETQRNSIDLITETAVHIEHEDDTGTPSQADDIIGPENAVSDVQPSNQQKKKKKHKLKDQQEVEPGADTHSADNVHSVEMDQFSDSQTTEMTPKRTKKKRKDREGTKTAHVEDDSGTDIQSNEAFEAPGTKQPEHIQTSEEITSPVARLKSGKKNGCEESVDFALDVSSVSQFDNVTDRSATQDAVEERPSDDVEHTEAELNDAEHSDSVQCADNLHEDDLAVIEERQRNSVEAVTEPAVEHENDVSSDNYLPNKSNSMSPPQGGDISTQNVIQQTDSDFGSEDLFWPLSSQNHKTNQNHKGASIKMNMEDSDQDSDVTQIETEGPFESIFGQETPRWCDADIDAREDNNSDETQIETEGQSVSVFGAGTPNKHVTESQSPLGINAELLSKRDEKVKSINNKKTKKTMSSSEKDSEDTDVEKTLNVQPFKHLPLADEPLREVFSSSCVRNILGKRRAREEMETDLPESPLFRNCGLSFIKRKRNRKDKTGATDLIQCKANADVSSESPVDDITGDKITPRENRKFREVKNRVTNEERREASVLHLEETELLEESILSTVADNGVIAKVKRKKKKKYKSNENEDAEPSVENQSVETAPFNESQTTELVSKVSKKKKRKDKERTKMAYVDENNATDIPSSETLDSDRPAELRVNEVNQSSEAPGTDQPDHTETSEEVTGCATPTLKSVKKKKKKKKKKRDETEEPETVDLDVSSVSQFDHVAGLGVVEQQEDQVIEERPNNDNTAEHILKVAKHKKKRQNASSPSQSDDNNRLEKQTSESQSESAEKLLKKKKRKLKERKNAEIALDIGDNVQLFQHSESQTTDLHSRKKTKKKRANKDTERTTGSSSNELSENMDDGYSEMRGNVIQATETDQLEHLQTSEEITRCPSPSVTKLSSGKKKKKKRDISEKHQDESVDVGLDASSVSQVDDVTGLIERRPNTAEHVENMNSPVLSNSMFTSKKKKKKKRDISEKHRDESVDVDLDASSVSQVDDVTGLIERRPNTAEHVDNMNSPVLSNSTFTSKKKKKHKLKDQHEAEPGADAHSAENVHSVEMDQVIELQSTEMTPKRAKKKRKDKERTKTARVEDDSCTDIQSNKTFDAPETEQPEHIQTSEEITGCLSPNVARLKLEKKKKKKKKKKNGSEESVDFPPDVSSVSQRSVEERPSDAVKHTENELNDTIHKKKRKRSSLSINNSSEFSSSDAKNQETATPERKRKKKRDYDHITNVGGELTSESSGHTVLQSQSTMLKSLETIPKKSRKKEKKNKEINASHVLDDSAELETVQTKRTDSTQANVISLGDYEGISKKKKKRKTDA